LRFGRVILGRQYLFSPQIEPSIFIFSQNTIYYSKNYPFSAGLKLRLKEIFAKGKDWLSDFLSRRRPIGASRGMADGEQPAF
jgi:hypothetical protein